MPRQNNTNDGRGRGRGRGRGSISANGINHSREGDVGRARGSNTKAHLRGGTYSRSGSRSRHDIQLQREEDNARRTSNRQGILNHNRIVTEPERVEDHGTSSSDCTSASAGAGAAEHEQQENNISPHSIRRRKQRLHKSIKKQLLNGKFILNGIKLKLNHRRSHTPQTLIYDNCEGIKNATTGDIVKDKVACIHCYHVFDRNDIRIYGTSNLRRHVCLLNINNNQHDEQINNEDTHKTLKCRIGNENNRKLTEAQLMFVARDVQPMTALHGVGLIQLLAVFTAIGSRLGALTRAQCDSILFSRHLMSNKIKEYGYKIITQCIKPKLFAIALQTAISFTVDEWTDKYSNQSYLGITAHFVDPKGILNDRTIALEHLPPGHRHTGAFLMKFIKGTMEKYGLRNLLQQIPQKFVFVSDRGSNIRYALDNLIFDNRVSCFAHFINNLVMRMLEQEDAVKIISKVGSIVTFFKHTRMNSQFKKKLRQVCKTRWNGTYYMLESYIINEQELTEELRKNMSLRLKEGIVSEAVIELCNFLGGFQKATDEVEGSAQPTICHVLPWYYIFEKDLQDQRGDSQMIKQMKIFGREYLRDKFILHKYHQTAAFLHPLMLNNGLTEVQESTMCNTVNTLNKNK